MLSENLYLKLGALPDLQPAGFRHLTLSDCAGTDFTFPVHVLKSSSLPSPTPPTQNF